ncbi:Ankyrin_repeat-containing domain superfamily [Hexamita inflata]|uniref:Ankyrin repeat-containing domain superfamily n=1 Tax=Hexamita inflata TaxID=28002 RepID=A0AA86UKW8_9EUKA|nr:Ankyrin repeat-containing domain superfamily [Hexamita inflata]
MKTIKLIQLGQYNIQLDCRDIEKVVQKQYSNQHKIQVNIQKQEKSQSYSIKTVFTTDMISLLVDDQNNLLNNLNTEQIHCDPVTQFDIIHIAIILKRVEFIQKYSNLCSKQSKLPYFHLALQYLPGVAYLFEFEIDRVNDNNETSLMYAVKGNNIYWAKQLIYQAGQISNQKQTALNFAKSDEMIRLLQMENNYSLQSRKLPHEHYFKSIKLFMEQNKEMKQLALDVKEADDFIKNNLQQKLKDFKQLNQNWCNRIDNCIDLNQIENDMLSLEIFSNMD